MRKLPALLVRDTAAHSQLRAMAKAAPRMTVVVPGVACTLPAWLSAEIGMEPAARKIGRHSCDPMLPWEGLRGVTLSPMSMHMYCCLALLGQGAERWYETQLNWPMGAQLLLPPAIHLHLRPDLPQLLLSAPPSRVSLQETAPCCRDIMGVPQWQCFFSGLVVGVRTNAAWGL